MYDLALSSLRLLKPPSSTVPPVDKRELKARISNLIGSRKRLKAWAGKEALSSALPARTVETSSADDVFLNRVRENVEQHIDDEDFGVEQLAEALGMSRVHLYRRLRPLTGQAPTEVILNVRLAWAADLLAKKSGGVNEVAYGVGFKSVSHFIKRFRHRYEMTPSAYAIDAERQHEGGRK